MSRSDYKTLWSVLDSRRSDLRSITSTEELTAYTAGIQEAAEPDDASVPAARSESGPKEGSLKEKVVDEKTALQSKIAKVESEGKSPPEADNAPADEYAGVEVHALSPGMAQDAPHSVKTAAEQGSSGEGVAFRNHDDQDGLASRGEITQGQVQTKAWGWVLPSIFLAALFLFLWKRR